MTTSAREVDLDSLEPPVCEFCGTRIDEPDRDCSALDDGVCAP